MHGLNDFLRLSAALNYQLSAMATGEAAELAIITNNAKLKEKERKVLIKALQYLKLAYGSRRRHLGPVAVLHPIRATAILARTQTTFDMCDLLASLLHDKLEDITPKDLGAARWNELEQRFRQLLNAIDPDGACQFQKRLELLTRAASGQTYYGYVGDLLSDCADLPGVLRVKLADRLDNTLDLRIDLQDPLEGVDFFEHVFQTMFVDTYKGFKPRSPHPPQGPMNGARRLYEMFKNTLLLTLIRQRQAIKNDKTAQVLFDAIARASRSEAQRILLHIFGYHLTSTKKQRCIIMEAMEYCQTGGINSVTRPRQPRPLDGLFLQKFDHGNHTERQEKLQELYDNKPLMAEAAVAFVVLFTNYLNDPKFYIKGIYPDGIRAEA